MTPVRHALALAAILVLTLATLGCTPRYETQVAQLRAEAVAKHAALGKALKNGTLLNAVLLAEYARILAREKPEMRTIAEALAREGTPEARAYAALGERLQQASDTPTDELQAEALATELLAVRNASDPQIYDDALADVLNTLADASDGTLPLRHVPENEAHGPPGTRLVGNPAYGHWQSGSGGALTWVFAGMFASSLLHSRPAWHYNDWYRSRPYSYYSDVGRSYYGGTRDNQRWTQARTSQPNVKPKTPPAQVRSRSQLSTYATTKGMRPPAGVRQAAGTGSRSSLSTYAASTRSRAASGSGGSRGGK